MAAQNPYAPPASANPSIVAIASPRELGAEAHVRGIGLLFLCSSAFLVFAAIREPGARRYYVVAMLVLELVAGIELLRLARRGRTLALAADVIAPAEAILQIATGTPLNAARVISLVVGIATSVWILWFLYRRSGARVLHRDYRSLLIAHPTPRPRIATWSKVLCGLMFGLTALTVLAWSFFADAPRTR